MAQTTWYISKDTRVALRQSDGLKQGGGASPALPFGYYSGYVYRAFLGFSHTLSSMNRIDKAVLWLRTSDQYYVSFGSDPDMNVALLENTAWSEGSSEGLSTGNATVYGDVGYLPELIQKDVTPSINTWVSVDITSLIQQAKTLGYFNGLQLSSTGTGSSDVGEFWSREKGSSYRPYIVVDYTNNVAPNPPTLTSPASGTKYVSATTTFTMKATASDPDAGDTVSKYHVQVSPNSGFTGTLMWDSDNRTDGISGMTITRAYPAGTGLPLVPGATYWWRMYTYDAAGLKSLPSAARTVVINAVPGVASGDRPYAGANHVAPIHNLADKVTTFTPKPQFSFKVTAADGEAITGYKVDISGVVTEVLGSWASGTTIVHKHATALTNLTTYTVRFQAKDAFEGYGAWSATTTFAVKYSQTIYQFNIPGASGLAATLGAITGSSAVLYRTATGASGAGAGSWGTSVPATVPAYLNAMVRLASSGTAPAQPKLTSLKFTYYAAVLRPLGWTFSGSTWAIDESMRKYGTKSLVGSGLASVQTANQSVPVNPDTPYVASVWVYVEDWTNQTVGLYIRRQDNSDYAPGVSVARDTAGWERLVLPFTSESEPTVNLVLRVGTNFAGTFHYDAVMVNEGTVAPVWEPALVAPVGTIDAQGVVIDGSQGGILRVFNSSGQPIEMGAVGRDIVFGEDVFFGRDAAGRLKMSTPVGGTSPRMGMEFDAGHAVAASGYFIWNAGDTVPRAALGKYTAGQGSVAFSSGSAGADVTLFRESATVLGINAGFKIGVGGSYQSIQMFSGGTINGGTMFDHGTGGGIQGRIIAYDTGGVGREVLRWDSTTGGRIGFYGAATGGTGNLVVGRQGVSGSRGANAALTSLLTALDNLGLITNSTT